MHDVAIKCWTKCILMYQCFLLMSVRGFCEGFAASALSLYHPITGTIRVCVSRPAHREQLFLRRHTPTSTPPGPPKTHVCQSHSIHIPHLSFLYPAHPHDTHTAPLLFIMLLLCNCLDDNAPHIMARRGIIWSQWRQFVYMGHIVPCRVPVMHAHCLNPMHTLLLPISRNSILLQRPNHQILFPGNFYPFMWDTMCAMGTKATTKSHIRLRKESRFSRPRFQAIFPGFISKSSGVENSILKEKWRGGGESWMKKRGVYGVIIQPPPKKASLSPFRSPFTCIISTNVDLLQNQSRSWWRRRGFGRWWANCR